MHARIPNHHSPSGPFNNIIPHQIRKHKQQPMFTYQGRQSAHNIYYEMNPYLLQITPSQQPRRPLISKSRNSSQSKEISDRSSHRSLKVIRVNGLRQVEKPKLNKLHDQHSLHSSKALDHSRKFIQREIELQNENKVLKGEQQALKEKIRVFEANKQDEIRMLKQKIEQLMQNMVDIQSKMKKGEEQWRERTKSISHKDNYE